MNVLYLAPDTRDGSNWRDAAGITGAPCAAWPRLYAYDHDPRAKAKRDAAWSLANARRGCEGKPAPRTIRGGIAYVDDPLALTMTPPAIGTVSLFR